MPSQVAQRLKHLPAMWETWVRSLGREDPLEKEVAPHSSTLAWRIPWMEEPGGLQSMRSQRVGHDWATSLHFTSEVQSLEGGNIQIKDSNINGCEEPGAHCHSSLSFKILRPREFKLLWQELELHIISWVYPTFPIKWDFVYWQEVILLFSLRTKLKSPKE